MITAGIDAGSENIKAVIWNSEDGRFLYCIVPIAQNTVENACKDAFDQVLLKAEINSNDVLNIAATGIGREAAGFARHMLSEVSCLAKGAGLVMPGAEVVVDIGAEKCLLLKCKNALPDKFVRNDKCAAGSGRYLEIAAAALGTDPEGLGELAMSSANPVEFTNRCAVFAESEIISLIHQKKPLADIAAGAFKSLAKRVYTMSIQIGMGFDLHLAGGVAQNPAMLKYMQDEMKAKVHVMPDPMVLSALGAAVLAEKKQRRGETC